MGLGIYGAPAAVVVAEAVAVVEAVTVAAVVTEVEIIVVLYAGIYRYNSI